MYRNFTSAVLSLIVLGGGLMSADSSQGCERTFRTCYLASGGTTIVNNHVSVSQKAEVSRSVTRRVQPTAPYRLARPEVMSGTRVTLFANFLEEKQGQVDLCLNGTSLPCEVIEWHDRSVTVKVPGMGLARPQDAVIRIIKPNGRIAKKYYVFFIPQPRIVTHAETVGQPDQSAPTSGSAAYVGGGTVCGE